MRKHWVAAFGLWVWIGGCKTPIEPRQVKKVEECVELFKAGIELEPAKLVARSLLEEKALTEEAVDAIHQCWQALPPETPHREILISEILAWIKEWDAEGRPKYLAQFFSHWVDDPSAFEGRQMAAAAFTDRLERVEEADEYAGLRAILSVLSRSLGDKQACVLMEGRQIDGKPMDRKQLLGLFAAPEDPNPWLASGLELAFEPRENCPGAVKVEFMAAPAGATGIAKLRARILVMRSDIIAFDKEYPVDPGTKVLFPDFAIP